MNETLRCLSMCLKRVKAIEQNKAINNQSLIDSLTLITNELDKEIKRIKKRNKDIEKGLDKLYNDVMNGG